MSDMRAKFRLHHVDRRFPNQETLHYHAVAASKYPADGSDENNTYANFTPSAVLQVTVNNPDLLGKFAEGEEYYLNFTKAA